MPTYNGLHIPSLKNDSTSDLYVEEAVDNLCEIANCERTDSNDCDKCILDSTNLDCFRRLLNDLATGIITNDQVIMK